MDSQSNSQWCLKAVETAETFERLLGLAAAFILDGEADYKGDTVFAEVRKAYGDKLKAFDFHTDDVRAAASRDPVRGLEDYITKGWSDIGPDGWIVGIDWAKPEPTTCPDVPPNPPRAIVSTVKASRGASNLLFER